MPLLIHSQEFKHSRSVDVHLVTVYCENHMEHTDTDRTSQETHYVNATKPNRLMLFKEAVAVYCENYTEHTDAVRTSQVTYYVSTTKPNRLMLFGETVAVYCENHMEHTDTDRTSQETHYVSAAKPNRLMLFKEAVAVCCGHQAEHKDTVRTSGNTLLLYCKAQPFNAVWETVATMGTIWNTQIQSVPHRKIHYVSTTDQPVNAVWGKSSCIL
jgi:hypothetical protein